MLVKFPLSSRLSEKPSLYCCVLSNNKAMLHLVCNKPKFSEDTGSNGYVLIENRKILFCLISK